MSATNDENGEFDEAVRAAIDEARKQAAPYLARVAKFYADREYETQLDDDRAPAHTTLDKISEWLTLTIRYVSLAPQLAPSTLGKEETASERWQVTFERSDVDAASRFAPWWDGSMTVLPV